MSGRNEQKYFVLSNLANIAIPEINVPPVSIKAKNKEDIYRGAKYSIKEQNGTVEINIMFDDKEKIEGSIDIILDMIEGKVKINLDVTVPLLGFVNYEEDVYYIAKGMIGKVRENIEIEGVIENDNIVVSNAFGNPTIYVEGMEIRHMNFSDSGEMCMGTIPTKFNISALPAWLLLVIKTIAMPTSHAWRSDECREYGTDVIINECIIPDDEHKYQMMYELFTKSNSPPKKFKTRPNLEEKFAYYVRDCYNYVDGEYCSEDEDEYYEDEDDEW